jgi:hypothetical protein
MNQYVGTLLQQRFGNDLTRSSVTACHQGHLVVEIEIHTPILEK